MRISGEGKLLRIYVGERDHYEHAPLYEVIIRKARAIGLAGATVLRGVEGFGETSNVIHTAKLLELSHDLPIIIEIIDSAEKLTEFLPIIDELFEQAGCDGSITIQKIEIIKYTHGKK